MLVRRWIAALAFVLALSGATLGFAFAGSPSTIAEGVRINGVEVGGLTAEEAIQVLERRSSALADVPIVFTTGKRRWSIRPSKVGLEVDWRGAVEAARHGGDGFGPVRGFRRLRVRFFGVDVTPSAQVFAPALDVRIRTIAAVLDRPHREAAVRLVGLRPVIVPDQPGRLLDRKLAARIVVRALVGFERTRVALPFRVDRPRVTTEQLRPVAAQVRTALSAPVRLTMGSTSLRLPRWRIAQLLSLPSGGATALRIAGRGADRYFARLGRFVNRKPENADFAVYSDGVRIVPAKEGRALDVPATVDVLLAAALSPTRRRAKLVVATKQADRTTADARAMGVTGLVAAYETIYGGDPNRISNVQLVSRLIDHHLIAPDEEFSFNETTGERTEEKGFKEAPVIINGELQTGIGGGVCQVSTTTFNAAFEAGLEITQRTNHALYISHYPQGRDATVNYPDLDLRFVNDTGHWLLLRTWVGSDRLTVALYGTPVHRRVESETSELRVTGDPPVKQIPNPELYKGETVVEESGSPSLATSVRRVVYTAKGEVLHDDTWSSSYRAEPNVVQVGTKPKPKPKPPPPPPTTTEPTTTEPTTTEPTTTEPTTTEPTTTEPTTTEPTTTEPTTTEPASPAPASGA